MELGADLDRNDFSIIWHCIVPWCALMTTVNQAQVRATLGKLTKQHGREALVIAFDRTLETRPRPVDPYTYFLALVSNGRRTKLNAAEQAWHDYETTYLTGRCGRADGDQADLDYGAH